MLVNYNEEILEESSFSVNAKNRAFKYGDSVFDTLKYANGKILFWEDHYFRLMSSMRILRMEIPMNFSPEYIEEQIIELITANHYDKQTCSVRISVFRKEGGKYTPDQNNIDWLIECERLESDLFEWNEMGLNTDVYKDHFKSKGLLSTIKSNNCLIYTLAGIYARENELDDVILINEDKHVVEAVSSNIFMIFGNELVTPTLQSGCLKGIMRKQIISIASKVGLTVSERDISPFEIQRASEVFLTNSIKGIQWVSRFKKKEFEFSKTKEIWNVLNDLVQNGV